MRLVHTIINSIDWSHYELLEGSAAGFGDSLAAFVADVPVDQRIALWATMENHVFSQDDIFSAAEPTLRVLFGALVDGVDSSTRHSILDLIFHIAHAASYRDDALGAQCVAAVKAASWLLIREALAGDANVAEACVEIIDIVEPNYAALAQNALDSL